MDAAMHSFSISPLAQASFRSSHRHPESRCMAQAIHNTNDVTRVIASRPPSSHFSSQGLFHFHHSILHLRCFSSSSDDVSSEHAGGQQPEADPPPPSGRTKGFKSSWNVKDSEGNDYLYRLGKEASNMNITVGARQGLIDDLFVGDFLGKDADIVFAYRQRVTRSFEHLQGDYYIAPAFMEKVALHIVKNFLAQQLDTRVPLILGIWGGKGQGKSFQTELIFKAMKLEPVILSAGELESEWAGEPGKLIRDRYRSASQVIKNKGLLSCVMINDLDAGIGRFGNTQMTVNNQMVVGTLMNLADNPTRVSIGQDWRDADIVNRVPIIVTGNDFSTLWSPLTRDGRMDKFYWQPTREDILKIVLQMYRKDGLSENDIGKIIDTFPNQANCRGTNGSWGISCGGAKDGHANAFIR